MNKRLADKWVKALRSGKYKQNKYNLKNSKNEYCCLGVLCEIEKPDSLVNDTTENRGYAFLSSVLQSDVGFISSMKISLADLNDCLDLSFDEIADIIQINYKEL